MNVILKPMHENLYSLYNYDLSLQAPASMSFSAFELKRRILLRGT
jgi:hypothetical protein